MIKKFALAAALMASSLVPLSAHAEDMMGEMKMNTPVIAMTGHGEVKMAPDQASITLGVNTSAQAANEALAQNNKAMQTLLDQLKASGIDAKDIQTSDFSIYPQYEPPRDNSIPKLSGYSVSNNVTIIVRDLSKLGPMLDQAVNSGSNQISGISFQVSKPDAALDEARKQAVADALHKAKIYSDAAGVTLGPIVQLSEGMNMSPPMPRAYAAMKARSADAVPIAAGEQTLSVDVNISWAIK